MKKITIGITVIFSLFTATGFAASTVTSQRDVSIPCYNSGLSFGLAGYDADPLSTSSEVTSSFCDEDGFEINDLENDCSDYK